MITVSQNGTLFAAGMNLVLPPGGAFYSFAAEIEAEDLTDGSITLVIGSNGFDQQRSTIISLDSSRRKAAGASPYIWVEPDSDGIYGVDVDDLARGVVWTAKIFAFLAPADVLTAP